MEFDFQTLALVSLILFASCLLQAVVGFAAGLFGIPLLFLAGLDLPQAITLVVIAGLVQSLLGVYKLRSDIVWTEVGWPIALRLATMPLGVATLWWVGELGPATTRRALGWMLLAMVAVLWLVRLPPRQQLPAVWSWLAFGGSGFLLGFCGMGGPLMAIWVMAHDWPTARARGFLFTQLLGTMGPHLLVLYWCWGGPVGEAMLMGVAGIPAVAAGAALGLRLARRLSTNRLRQLVYLVVLALAIRAIQG